MNNTLANGLHLLAELSATAAAHTVTELATRLQVPKSHAHRLLQTLVELGYAVQDPDRRYRIGLEPLAISKALLANHPLRRLAMPHLHRLAEATGMDAIASVPHRGGSAIILAAVYPGGEQRDAISAVGNRLGHPGSATGALFACLIPGFAEPVDIAAARRRAIARELVAVRDPGFAGTTNGMAAAVRAGDGAVVGALGLSAPGRVFAERYERSRTLLRTAADAIERQLADPTANQENAR
jgi:IclR family KDG regulon transcriptional repressor